MEHIIQYILSIYSYVNYIWRSPHQRDKGAQTMPVRATGLLHRCRTLTHLYVLLDLLVFKVPTVFGLKMKTVKRLVLFQQVKWKKWVSC